MHDDVFAMFVHVHVVHAYIWCVSRFIQACS